MSSLSQNIEIILGLAALISIIWRVAQAEKRVYDHIKDSDRNLEKQLEHTKELLYQRLDSLERKLDLHSVDMGNKQEFDDYRIHGLNEKIDHKFKRLQLGQQDIQRYLEKTGFVKSPTIDTQRDS